MLIKVFLKMFASCARGLAAQCERSLIPPLPSPPLSPYAAHRFKKHLPHNVLSSLQENQVHKGQSIPAFRSPATHPAPPGHRHALGHLPLRWYVFHWPAHMSLTARRTKEALAVFMLRLTDEYKDAGKSLQRGPANF